MKSFPKLVIQASLNDEEPLDPHLKMKPEWRTLIKTM